MTATEGSVLATAIANLDVDAANSILQRYPHLANELTTLDEDIAETMLCFAIARRVDRDYAAVSDEQLLIVKALIEAGADLETVRHPRGSDDGSGGKGMFPLGTAAWLGKLRLVDLLLKAGAVVDAEPTPTDTAIEVAADHRHAEVVERLVEAGAAYNAKTLAQAGLIERLGELLDDDPEAVNRPVHLGHLSGVYGPPLLALVEEYGFEDPHARRGAVVD